MRLTGTVEGGMFLVAEGQLRFHLHVLVHGKHLACCVFKKKMFLFLEQAWIFLGADLFIF